MKRFGGGGGGGDDYIVVFCLFVFCCVSFFLTFLSFKSKQVDYINSFSNIWILRIKLSLT